MQVKIITGELRTLSPEEKKAHPPYCYVITKEWICKTHNGIITVPKGFLTDGASGGPDYGCSWIFHDWLYSTHKYDDGTPVKREDVDSLMKTILTLEGMGWYVWAFNKMSSWNIFYLFSKAWESSGKRGPEFWPDQSRLLVENYLRAQRWFTANAGAGNRPKQHRHRGILLPGRRWQI